MPRRLRVKDRVVPSKSTFIQTAARQHVEMMELADDVKKLQAVIRVLGTELQAERAKTIRSRILEKVKEWAQRFVRETAKIGAWQ